MYYDINIINFILLMIIVYSSSFLGYYVYRLSKDEVENNKNLLRIFLKLTFLLINIIFFYNSLKQINFILLFLMLLSIIIIVLKGKICMNMYFSYLAIIFSLSYFYNIQFYYITILTFIYNLTVSSYESTNKSLKKILLEKTSFIAINLISLLWYLLI